MLGKRIIDRIQKLKLPPDRSAFLWGPRKTGKTTLLKRQFPKAYWIDLLDHELFLSLNQNPSRLRQILEAQSSRVVVIGGVSVKTIREVYQILEDTLIGRQLPPGGKTKKI